MSSSPGLLPVRKPDAKRPRTSTVSSSANAPNPSSSSSPNYSFVDLVKSLNSSASEETTQSPGEVRRGGSGTASTLEDAQKPRYSFSSSDDPNATLGNSPRSPHNIGEVRRGGSQIGSGEYPSLNTVRSMPEIVGATPSTEIAGTVPQRDDSDVLAELHGIYKNSKNERVPIDLTIKVAV